jgi:hypothetical protein
MELQVSVDVCPAVKLVGLADRDTIGAGVGRVELP